MALKPWIWLALIGLAVLPACSQPVYLAEGDTLVDGQSATVLGGGLPSLRSVDGEDIPPNFVAGMPDTVLAAGQHSLVIDYQPCANANSCALVSVPAEVVLEAGHRYDIRHRKFGCTLWSAVTAFTRLQEIPCRNYLWIEDHETGAAVWGTAPASWQS